MKEIIKGFAFVDLIALLILILVGTFWLTNHILMNWFS